MADPGINIPEAIDLPRPVQQFLDVVSALGSLIEMESEALRARRLGDLGKMQAEKARLTRQYDMGRDFIRRNTNLLGSKDSPSRQKVRGVLQRFQDAVMENGRLIMRMKTVSEGLVGALLKEARKQRPMIRNYGANATVQASSQPGDLAMTFNEII